VTVDEATLETANEVINESGFFGIFVLVPVVDGEFIVERPIETIQRGRLNGVSLVLCRDLHRPSVLDFSLT
jgi:hypothetical protein